MQCSRQNTPKNSNSLQLHTQRKNLCQHQQYFNSNPKIYIPPTRKEQQKQLGDKSEPLTHNAISFPKFRESL